MFLVLNGVISGAEGWSDIEDFSHDKLQWLRQFRHFEQGIPTRHSIARIIRSVNIEQLSVALYSWVNEQREQQDKPLIAIDGKTVRGAVNRSDKGNTLHLVSAFDTQQGLVLFQQATQGKGTEIQAVRDLFSMLDIKGRIFTLDALHNQSDALSLIDEQGGDYVVQVKANQKTLHPFIQSQFAQTFAGKKQASVVSHAEESKGHGREETRTLWQLPVRDTTELHGKWQSANSLITIERCRKQGKKTTYSTYFYLSSLACDAQLAFNAVRQHRHIENQQHWILDVVYHEDMSLIGDREAAEVFALLRRISLNLAKRHPKKSSHRRKLKQAGWSDSFRAELFFC
jgi:predicted transposase YbfD/YdcC